MLRVWRLNEFRPTMDIDMLGRASNEEAIVAVQIRDVMVTEVVPDGIVFVPDSIRTERITEDADYGGIRVRFLATLGSARVYMQLDIGFGDLVYPNPEASDLPVMLDFPTPRLHCYSRESAIAEKFEAMVKLGVLNSRMKDFYDIWLLSRQCDFEGDKLAEAIRVTFQRRGTALPSRIEAFEQSFVDAKQVQWLAFRKRLQQDHVPEAFKDIVSLVQDLLKPLVSQLSEGSHKSLHWSASGQWS